MGGWVGMRKIERSSPQVRMNVIELGSQLSEIPLHMHIRKEPEKERGKGYGEIALRRGGNGVLGIGRMERGKGGRRVGVGRRWFVRVIKLIDKQQAIAPMK